MFIAHYEHVLLEPRDYIEPLSSFLDLNPDRKKALEKRLTKKGKLPSRKAHDITRIQECKGLEKDACYSKYLKILDEFFHARSFMWPTFAGNGFDMI